MIRSKALAALAALSLVIGCGNEDDGETSFGDAADLRAYRNAINPIIDEVSAIENEVAQRAYNSSGTLATNENLNAVFQDARPRLLEALVDLDRIEPPSSLRSLHDDIRMMIVLRLDAYALVMDGYNADDDSKYPEAEQKLADANALIPDLNSTLCDIDQALGATQDCRLVA